MEVALNVNKLKKKYGSKEVLKEINFSVNKGEIFGILGGNGAGKTTTLESLSLEERFIEMVYTKESV